MEKTLPAGTPDTSLLRDLTSVIIDHDICRRALMSTSAAVIDFLGGGRILGREVTTDGALSDTLRRGLPFAALVALQKRLELSDAELALVAGIHPRTLARRKTQKRLRADESDRVSRVARVAAHAVDVLGSEANAVKWLRHPNRALGGGVPLRLLSTDLGVRRIEAILAHIDWGDLS